MEIEPVDISLFSIQNEPPLKRQPFISAILYIREMLKKILDSIEESSISSIETTTSSSRTPFISIDTLHFGVFLYEMQRLKEQGLFDQTIALRREEIQAQKEHWAPFIKKQEGEFYQEFYRGIELVLAEGKLVPNPSGAGSAYFLVDAEGITRFVVKPVDEDIFCLNNRKEFGSIFNDVDHRVREDIPLYRSAQADAFCWEIASLAGIEGATPKAVMGIIANDDFYDFTQWIDSTEDREKFFPDREKLVSIQEFIPDSQDLIEVLHSFYQEELTDEELASHFDQKEFEEVCLLLWLSLDTDAHGANFRSYVKRIDENGNEVYGIKKIDNGLSFPEKNSEYSNILAWMPNAMAPISEDLKSKIANLPIEQILKRIDDYELTGCKEALKERIEILKELASRDAMTIGEIDLRFTILAHEGKELALSPMTTQEIIDFLGGGKSTGEESSS
jgi:hypothetical protein